jgi:glycosyltransferase involved in cell wall biosynthesis
MKALQICNKSPYPAKEGGPIAMNAITQMLQQQGYEVKILAINTPKYAVATEEVDADYQLQTAIEWIWVDNRVKMRSALISLLKNSSYHVERFKSKEFAEKIRSVLSEETFDIVVLETVYLSVYIDVIRNCFSGRLVLRAHNVEHLIWERIAKNTFFGLKKLYLSILARQLRAFEKSVIPRYDEIWCISAQDMQWFENQNRNKLVKLVPFGIKSENISNKPIHYQCNNLFFLGSMDWYPNKEGIVWFLDNVWNTLLEKYPDLRFRIAGRNIPPHWKQLNYQGVEIVGEVASAADFLEENGVMVVPLWSGSGVRIKIIEAMAAGKVIITTTIGLEGIGAIHKKNVLLADTVNEFVDAVTFCLQQPAQCQAIAENARQFILENHTITPSFPSNSGQ